MLEDFWLPRREGGKGTEITTLPPGQNLGQMEDVQYFQKKLYQSLNVPVSRLQHEPSGMIGLGRTTEITRDELKFAKFINKLRNRFMQLFDNALKIQLSLKGICTTEEWQKMLEDIHYDFAQDNNFAEMRDAELLRERINTLQLVQPFVGTYYSQEWVKKNILMQTDEDIEEMTKQMALEAPPPGQEGQEGQGGQQQGDDQQQGQDDQQQDEDQSGGNGGGGNQQRSSSQDEDNTQDSDGGVEDSLTPMLDSEVEKYSKINKRK
jgi:ribosomal protein L12E/L44/L45/RPP1/RPP2